MSSAKSDAYRAELEAALSVLVLPLEGFQYDDKLAPPGEVAEEIDGDIEQFQRRQARIYHVLTAMDDLDADGYPELPIEAIPGSVYSVLRHQADAILAALARFTPLAEAVSVEMAVELLPNGETALALDDTDSDLEPQV